LKGLQIIHSGRSFGISWQLGRNTPLTFVDAERQVKDGLQDLLGLRRKNEEPVHPHPLEHPKSVEQVYLHSQLAPISDEEVHPHRQEPPKNGEEVVHPQEGQNSEEKVHQQSQEPPKNEEQVHHQPQESTDHTTPHYPEQTPVENKVPETPQLSLTLETKLHETQTEEVKTEKLHETKTEEPPHDLKTAETVESPLKIEEPKIDTPVEAKPIETQ